MRFLSVCSGIEAASVAWNALGWKAWAFSEIDKFPSAVLAHRYPDVPNLGDMTNFKEWPDATLDVLCGGTPCQSFSNAGLRAGLDDPRGQLMLTFGAIAARYRPRWLVWENVPGVLSSNGGRDFGAFLGLLGFLGYGFAYRVLDAQFVRVDGYGRAVPQRRNRVFVVGCLGDWRSAAAVLLERESLRGDSAPRRRAGAGAAAGALAGVGPGSGWRVGADEAAAGQIVAATLTAGVKNGGAGHGARSGHAKESTLIAAYGGNNTSGPRDVASALSAHGGSGRMDFESETFVAHTLRGDGFDASEDGTGRGTPLVPVPFDTTQLTSAANRSNPQPGDPCHPLAAGGHAPAIAGTMTSNGDAHTGFKNADGIVGSHAAVRRLTPRECERLQGFPPIAERIILNICIDHQSGLASVALQCLKWQSSVSPADGEGLNPFVSSAALDSSISRVSRAPLAVLHVLPQSEGESAELHSHARSTSSASGVNGYDWCRRSTLPGGSVRVLAPALRDLAHSILAGKAASPLHMLPSTAAQSGSKHAPMSGGVTEGAAASAASAPLMGTFTTSDLGQLRPISDSREATLCCSVLTAIAGCIPSETLPASFSLELTIATPYTLIPWRGGMASDGPRYKALGNSWAVNCPRWVGQRIAFVDTLKVPVEVAA